MPYKQTRQLGDGHLPQAENIDLEHKDRSRGVEDQLSCHDGRGNHDAEGQGGGIVPEPSDGRILRGQ